MKCNHCGYEWETRTDNPKACPRCKNRLDITRQPLNGESPSNSPGLSEKKECETNENGDFTF